MRDCAIGHEGPKGLQRTGSVSIRKKSVRSVARGAERDFVIDMFDVFDHTAQPQRPIHKQKDTIFCSLEICLEAISYFK